MDEIKFVLKCLVCACLVFALSQYQLDDGSTIEANVHGYLVSSSTARFVNETARGGAKFAKNISVQVSDYLGLKKEVKSRPIHSAVQKKKELVQKEKFDIEEDIELE